MARKTYTEEGKQEYMKFIDVETNRMYECYLDPKDAQRARTDMQFAQSILNGLISREETERNEQVNLSQELQAAHYSSDAESSQVPIYEGKWTHEQTLLLITLYGEQYAKMKTGKMLLRNLWKSVAEGMLARGYKFTPDKCSMKFDTLKRKYRKVLDHNRQSGNDRKSFTYYEEIHEIFRKEPWVQPIAVASNELIDATFENINERCSSDSGPSNRKRNGILEELLQEKKLRRIKTEAYREKKVALLEKLIEVVQKK